MLADLAYLIGVLASWAGWLLAARAVVMALQLALARPWTDRRAVGVSLAWTASLGGGLLVLSGGVAQAAGRPLGGGVPIPIFWIVAPWTAWGSLACAAAAIGTALRHFASPPSQDDRSWIRVALFWTLGAALFGVLHVVVGGPVELLRGVAQVPWIAAVGILILLVGATSSMVWFQRHPAAKTLKLGAQHLALAVGSVVFGLPFVWLLLTSFKEDVDMASPEGLVWIPKVTQTVPYYDPERPLVETQLEGFTARGDILQRNPDGSAVIDIAEPYMLRGRTVTAQPPLRIVARKVPLAHLTLDGRKARGRVVQELDDGGRVVEVFDPPEMKGRLVQARPGEAPDIRQPGLRWQNYWEALQYLPPEANLGLAYLNNTLILVVLSVIGTLLSSSLVAYGFARIPFPGRETLFLVLLGTMMLPAAVTMLPNFLIFRWLGWVDTLMPLWVPAFFASAFNVFLFRQFFLGIPKELEDAATLDGCNPLRTYWQVMLPQLKPAVAVVAIWTFMGAWNNFMGPLIFINSSEKMPIAYAVQLYQADRAAEPGLLMAFATMSIVPVLAVFFFAQKYFIEGVSLSGLGGR
ncbi:MAG: hypothetical protein DCC46_05915 [Armatimonadetes bacterium]|nr:MAG: hypothetical protein DCC46_05915 [Armatimonadota bacterium]